MAAGGWRDWTEGELVTEALFQDIQDSIAFIFSSESAANSALTRKVVGTQFFDSTALKLKIWTGSAWVVVGGGLSELDTFALTANIAGTDADITANLARYSTTNSGFKGTGMSQSSGVFTFPSTGFYLITAKVFMEVSNDAQANVVIKTTDNNSSFTDVMIVGSATRANAGGTNYSVETSVILDIADTSNDKVKFATDSFAGSTTLLGNTVGSLTSFKFIRLADT
tara:strand:+ start:3236 stop:3910 length:675 start_codon:yes stop_codon:yes gene_type:complete